MNTPENDRCELCGRPVDGLTRHHLVPRTRHSNRRNKRDFGRADVTHRIAWLCRPCHDHVHAVFTEKTLEREYNTLERLREAPAIARFVQWIADKPPDFRPPMGRRMKGRR
jgi:ribosomal protein L34E